MTQYADMRCRFWHIGFFLVTAMVAGTASNEGKTYVSNAMNSSDILRNILEVSSPGVRPGIDGPPVIVRCGFYIVNFGPFSEVNMDYRLDIYFRQKWVDARLKFKNVGETDHVILSAKDIERLWKPDLFFTNEKSASFHYVTVPNKLMRIYHNGTVVYSTRITLTLACKMDLSRFPMDHQRCSVEIESYGYEIKDVLLEWDDDYHVNYEKGMQLPQFRLVSSKTIDTAVVYSTGTFPHLTATFDLERLYGVYLLQTYIPTILIVTLAWVSFWVNMDSAPARVSLGVTTVLTMAAQLSGSKASIPKVHYPKAIDIWMAMCMLFVFVAMLEYAIVNALLRYPRNVEEKKKDREVNGNEKGCNELKCESFYVFEPRLRSSLKCGFKSGKDAAIFLDRLSRVCFPICFVVFNIVYWSVYLRPYNN